MSDSQEEPPSALGRLLYGGILAYMGFDGFRNNKKRVSIAREKGVPFPELLVPLATGLLILASIGIIFWTWPLLAAVGLIVFFLGTTPKIHNFWELEGKERQENKINFLKNIALLGAAITFLDEAWDRREG